MDMFSNSLSGITGYLPITAAIALILFVLKEGLEWHRRSKATKRLRLSVRRLIADDLERNNWVLKTLRDAMNQIERVIDTDGSVLSIKDNPSGLKYIRRDDNGELGAQFPLRPIAFDALTANIKSVAEHDESKFDEALEALDALKELDHIRSSMIEHVIEWRDDGFLEGFVDYARATINSSESTIRKFYSSITGATLDSHRVR